MRGRLGILPSDGISNHLVQLIEHRPYPRRWRRQAQPGSHRYGPVILLCQHLDPTRRSQHSVHHSMLDLRLLRRTSLRLAGSPVAASNREIAASLSIGGTTVKTHFNNIFSKAGLRDRAQAVVYAIRNGLAD
jgi:DNA-binding CsgD family transcriptional regulator